MQDAKRYRGFTLIEAMIVVVIAGIFATMAIPSYQNYIRKSRRNTAQSTLLSIQMAEEKHRANNTTYGGLADVWGGVTTTENGYYALTITNNTASGYTLTATGQNGQQNDSQGGTACSPLVITVNGATTTKTPAACWN